MRKKTTNWFWARENLQRLPSAGKFPTGSVCGENVQRVPSAEKFQRVSFAGKRPKGPKLWLVSVLIWNLSQYCSKKTIRAFVFSMNGRLVYRRLSPAFVTLPWYFVRTHLDTWVERNTESKVSCPNTQHYDPGQQSKPDRAIQNQCVTRAGIVAIKFGLRLVAVSNKE